MPKNHFHENLKHYRKINFMSQKQLADKLNVARQTISNYENKTRNCDIDMLIDIADALGISVDELVR